MYRCKECGCEYEEKPDYCDCGNDEFVLVKSKGHDEIKENVQVAEKVNIQRIQEPVQKKNTTQLNLLKSLDPFSGGIFIFCLILSFYIIFFAWNPNETTENAINSSSTVTAAKSIPDIDSFWNNQVPKKDVKKVVETKPIENKTIIQTPKIVKVELKKVQSKQAVKPVTKQTSTVKNTSQNTNQNKNITKTQPVQKTTPSSQIVKPVQPQKTASEIAAEEAAKKAAEAKKAVQLKQEYANYKVGLRNTIGRKIDFTRVVGDGSCTVAFKIDSSGKLISRSFAKQSSNITLNDAVYAAIMSTPSYNPPPEGYKNETLNLNIKFYNGNFEISLN